MTGQETRGDSLKVSIRCEGPCGEEYRGRPDKGGLLFVNKAYCPKCALRLEEDALRYNEVKFIRARAEPEESFADFVLRLRNQSPRVSHTDTELYQA